jgi:hypothetical protein
MLDEWQPVRLDQMIKEMVHGLIAPIHIQFNVFDPQQSALPAHFKQSLFPNPFLLYAHMLLCCNSAF